jgi:N-dimethylarginine dimethylaminohydrolase
MSVKVYGVNSEYAEIASVLLYRPGHEIANYPEPERIKHLAAINHDSLMLEYDAITARFESLGITVNMIDSTSINDDRDYNYNMMYCRDLFMMTPHGAILGNMANIGRSQEPLYAARTMKLLGIPLLHIVSGEGRFEGADALWIRNDLVIVGVGNRTNHQGYLQIRDVLKQQGVSCVDLPSFQSITQHLLGSVQIVDSDSVLVRHEIIDSYLVHFLRENDFKVVAIPENREVITRQAMNIITIAPRTIIMTANCPETRALYQKAGINIAGEIELAQLINGAGGLACATGILARAC